MPKTPKTPAIGGNDRVLPSKPRSNKTGFAVAQSRMPKGLKQLPGGGKGGKPPRFPGRAGGR